MRILYELGDQANAALDSKPKATRLMYTSLSVVAVGETLNLLRHSVALISSKPKLVHGPWQPSLVIKTSDLYQHRTSLCLPGLLD